LTGVFGDSGFTFGSSGGDGVVVGVCASKEKEGFGEACVSVFVCGMKEGKRGNADGATHHHHP
jgi:hypothetical protein